MLILVLAYAGYGGAPPGIDPQVYQWFTAVDADKSGKITALELQQALTNSNWSHFNAETCRLMIGVYMKLIFVCGVQNLPLYN